MGAVLGLSGCLTPTPALETVPPAVAGATLTWSPAGGLSEGAPALSSTGFSDTPTWSSEGTLDS
jgi:hypothetical protein